jgi:hypothetical protein
LTEFSALSSLTEIKTSVPNEIALKEQLRREIEEAMSRFNGEIAVIPMTVSNPYKHSQFTLKGSREGKKKK